MSRFLHRVRARAERRSSPLRPLRPRLETLEDRANPVALSFVPMSNVAVNPQPLPPSALVQFNPLPVVTGILTTGSTVQSPIMVEGSFQQTLTVTGPGANPVAETGRLTVTYNLQGTVNETVTPAASATQPATYSATYTLSGKETEILFVPAPPGMLTLPPWVMTGTITEQGTVSGPLNPPQTGSVPVDPMSFTSQITLAQTASRLSSVVGTPGTPWSVQSTVQSTGAFQVQPLSPTPPFAAPPATPFTAQDKIAQTVQQVTSNGTPPPPAIQIAATAADTGTVTEFAFPVGPFPVVPIVDGATQYSEALNETITYPPTSTAGGSTQTLTQAFDTHGTFQEAEFSPVLDPPLAPIVVAVGGN